MWKKNACKDRSAPASFSDSVSCHLTDRSHSPSPYLSHVGDEEGQPGAEEEPQQDPQSQAGLERPPPVPVS